MAAGSVVDYLNSRRQNSSFSARKKLAEQYGISGYTGTAAQNTNLLNKLQETGPGAPAAPSPASSLPYPTVAPGDGRRAATIVQGGGSSSRNQGPGVSGGPGVRDDDILEEDSGSDYLSGYRYRSFSPSDRTERYYEKLMDLEDSKPGDYQSRWQGDIDTIVESIMNREKFKTDDVFDSDLYKTYREQYLQNGQKAMRDAAGNAQGMAGGYGSTYAIAAGQQAYDNYLSQLGDKTLDLYDRVYNEYLQEGMEMYNQLSMLNNQDSVEYGRYRDQVADYYNDLGYYSSRYDSEYNKDFGEWQADNAAQQWAEEYAYRKTQDELAQQNWQTEFDYQKEQDAYARQLQQEQLALQAARSSSGGGGRRSSGSGRASSGQADYSDGELVSFAKDLLNEKDSRNGSVSREYYTNDASTVRDILIQYAGVDERTASAAVAEAQKSSRNKTDNSYTYRKAR